MKILYSGGFSEEEKMNYKDIILTNTLLGMQELLKQAGKLDLVVSADNQKRARLLLGMNVLDEQWSGETGQKLRTLWQDPAIQQAWQQTEGLSVVHLDRYTAEGFVPTNDDMLRARQRTTGGVDTIFEIDKTEWKIIDCGGQKPERAKWQILLTDNPVKAVIFFLALNEYNIASGEEQGKTKMQIAMDCFREVVASEQTKSMSIILFLNKKDLLEKKFQTDFKEFQDVFPKYTGGSEIQPATEFIGNQFRSIMQDGGRTQEELCVHVTCALDTEAMDSVFQTVRETLFTNNMKMFGVDM